MPFDRWYTLTDPIHLYYHANLKVREIGGNTVQSRFSLILNGLIIIIWAEDPKVALR